MIRRRDGGGAIDQGKGDESVVSSPRHVAFSRDPANHYRSLCLSPTSVTARHLDACASRPRVGGVRGGGSDIPPVRDNDALIINRYRQMHGPGPPGPPALVVVVERRICTCRYVAVAHPAREASKQWNRTLP
jgi:hypothetical protein